MNAEFKSQKGIFQQIADVVCQQILKGKLTTGERIPSVRDLAAEYEVNRNTALRACQALTDEKIVDNQRGVGFFVTENAVEIIKKHQRADFFAEDLPEFISKIKLLNLKEKDLTELLNILK
ncbi:MAG: GntR family transcriptional regulator [Paludibacter sp.]|nr:GntR family transcriptional regulator [Paludibacter sp.]